MNRRLSCCPAAGRLPGWLLLCCVWCLGVSLSRAADRPNVLLILADDLGYGDVRFRSHLWPGD